MWQADGWDARARIGALTPHLDVGPESEMQAMAPDGVRIHASRVLLTTAKKFSEPPHVDDATELLAAAPMRAIAYAFTSSAYVIGADGEAKMITRLEKQSNGIPVVATGTAAVLALRALDVQRIALVHPPWFAKDVDALGAKYFTNQGFKVVYHDRCGLPSNQQSINPPELYGWIRVHVPDTADAVFIGGNGLRAVGVIAALEEDLGRPILSANQVLFWHALHSGKVRIRVAGYGQIFEQALPTV